MNLYCSLRLSFYFFLYSSQRMEWNNLQENEGNSPATSLQKKHQRDREQATTKLFSVSYYYTLHINTCKYVLVMQKENNENMKSKSLLSLLQQTVYFFLSPFLVFMFFKGVLLVCLQVTKMLMRSTER